MVNVSVTARDQAGHTATVSRGYTVSAPPTGSFPLMGTSVPNSGPSMQYQPLHGGYTQWDVIRVYDFSDVVNRLSFQPKIIALTEESMSIQGGGAAGTALRDFLEGFYYSGGQPIASRANIEIHFANGNEYGDKVTNQSAFASTMTALRAAVDATNSNGTRRFPKAYLGLDPTHFQEQNGLIAPSLMPVAHTLDFVAWSDYPPGRSSSAADPRFDKPGTNPTAVPGGFLERTIQRTLAAKNASGRNIAYECWEVGIGDDPDDRDHRPYYVAHSLARWLYERCQQVGLDCKALIWWNQQKNEAGAPENVFSNEPAATNPSTATAWRNWRGLIPEYGGTKPANWPSAPKASWPTGA